MTIKETGEEWRKAIDVYYKIPTQISQAEKGIYWLSYLCGSGLELPSIGLDTRFGSAGLEYILVLPHIVCVSVGNYCSLTLYYFLFSFVQMKCAKHVNPRAGHTLSIVLWICRLRIRWMTLKWYRRQMHDLLLGKEMKNGFSFEINI